MVSVILYVFYNYINKKSYFEKAGYFFCYNLGIFELPSGFIQFSWMGALQPIPNLEESTLTM